MSLKPQQIEVPSKWDIIPIHTSDRATFKSCRRRWAWSSPSKFNLVPRASIHGVRIPLWFGTGIHKALEKYYDPVLREDPVAVWLTWFDTQWNGGKVSDDEVAEYRDREPAVGNDGMWVVRGLSDLLPTDQEEEFMQLRDLGRGMMEFYKSYAEREDDFQVISVEHDFSVPILDLKGNPLYKIDTRKMPQDWQMSDEENMYGRLMYTKANIYGVFKQVHARGRNDKIIQEREGRYGILDHKTTARLDDDYFRHLELDEQCTTYIFTAQREAEMYDLEYKSIDFIIYEAIFKAYPRQPTMLKSGMPSLDRQKESTTAEMFEQFIRDNGLKVVFDRDPKMQAYYTWLLELGEKRYIHRERVWRNKKQRENAGIRMYYEAMDMLSDPRLYPNPRKEYTCLNCIFRAPCIAVEDGSDWKSMLEDGYIENWDR